jgi:hypothetical protein
MSRGAGHFFNYRFYVREKQNNAWFTLNKNANSKGWVYVNHHALCEVSCT